MLLQGCTNFGVKRLVRCLRGICVFSYAYHSIGLECIAVDISTTYLDIASE